MGTELFDVKTAEVTALVEKIAVEIEQAVEEIVEATVLVAE